MTVSNAVAGAVNAQPKTRTFLAKGIGAVGLAAVMYDAHNYGKIHAQTASKLQKADGAVDAYVSGSTSNSSSTIASKLQDFRTNMELNGGLCGGIRNGFAQAKGYLVGVGKSLVDNAIPLVLSTATLLTKGKLSKALGVVTAGYGACKAATTLGAGKTNWLKR